MAVSRNQMIEFDSPRDVEDWSARFGVSGHELVRAVRAVGPAFADVEAYLRSAREPMGAYVDRMRSRLDEIEIQFQQLSEERKSIVAFLEGFAQLQRTQPLPSAVFAVPISSGDEPEATQSEYQKNFEEMAFRNVVRSAFQNGSAAPVLDVVYRLLSDQKRRTVHEILSFLEVRGVPLKGANSPGYLSTLLSRDPRFDANRRDGWGLARHG